jgi:hypothetical protein
MIGWWDTALYVTVDAQSLKDAEEREERELRAQSCVVRHARVEQTHRAFWRRVDARRAASPSGRLLPFAPAPNAARG